MKLKRKVQGATLQHRPGYFTPVPFAERSPQQRRAEAARWILEDEERNGLDVTLQVDVARQQAPAAEGIAVEVVLAPSAAGAGEQAPASVEIYGYAIATDGTVAGYFEHRALAGEAVRYQAVLSLEPGIYDIRVLVRDDGNGATATRKQRVEIPGRRRTGGR